MLEEEDIRERLMRGLGYFGVMGKKRWVSRARGNHPDAYNLLSRGRETVTDWGTSLFYIGNSAPYKGHHVLRCIYICICPSFLALGPGRPSPSRSSCLVGCSRLLTMPGSPPRCTEQDEEVGYGTNLQRYLVPCDSEYCTSPCMLVVIPTVAGAWLPYIRPMWVTGWFRRANTASTGYK